MVGNHQASVKKWLFRVPGIRLSIDAHSDNLPKKNRYTYSPTSIFFRAFGSEPDFFFLGHILWLCLQVVTKRSRKADDLWASSQPSVDYESGANAFRDPKSLGIWHSGGVRVDEIHVIVVYDRGMAGIAWYEISQVYDMLSQVETYIYICINRFFDGLKLIRYREKHGCQTNTGVTVQTALCVQT